MEAFIIEQGGQIREAFSYDRPIIEGTQHALEEYARATYGEGAVLRPMTRKEQEEFTVFGPEFFKKTDNDGKAVSRQIS